MFKWRRVHTSALLSVTLCGVVGVSCVRNPPVAPELPPPPPAAEGTTARPPTPPAPDPPPPAPPAIGDEDDFASRDLEELNRDSPLRPLFFRYDSSELDADGRTLLDTNMDVLRRYPTWVVTIEGHCDERGTAEYNLALGERRALTAREYLVGRGLDAGRVRTVSYGKEFPFDPGGDDRAWARNRRAHFVITAK